MLFPPATAKRWSRSSEVPTASLAPRASTSSDHASAPSAETVCAQCCVSRSHTRTVASLLHVTSRRPEADAPRVSALLSPSTKHASVTCPLCPLRRHRPASATTSHTTTFVSFPPDTSREPSRENRSAVTSLLCPFKRTSVLPSTRFHRRIDPSLAPAATTSLPGARAMRVTAGSAPLSRGGGTSELARMPRRTSHTARRSSAAQTRFLPPASYTGAQSGDATTPNERACS